MHPLDNSAEPLYVRLKEAIRDRIGSGMQPGDKLPSETELVETYGVSRMTVRLAMGALENEGVIVRKQGKGTFLAQPKQTVPYFGSFLDEMAARGRSVAARLVSFEVVHPAPQVADRLGVDRTDRIYKIRRVRTLDGQSICYQVNYLPEALFPGLSHAAASGESLHATLEGLLEGRLDDADETVEALLADPYRAELLGVEPGAALMLIERLVFDDTGRAVDLDRSFYPGQLARLQLRLHAAPTDTPGHRLALHTDSKASFSDD
jgi:GntR family transcriptional regulator